jgi:hypothetical protein
VTEVLVIGFGPAGASAAIAAHDAGAQVTVLEKMPYGGGNCLNSGGFLVDVDGPRAVEHLEALCFGKTPRDVLEAYLDGLREVPSWIESLGGATAPVDLEAFMGMLPSWPHFPGAGHVTYRQVVPGESERPGPALFGVLREAVERRGIEVRYDSPVTELPAAPLRRRDGLGGPRQAALPDHLPAAAAQSPAHARLPRLRRARTAGRAAQRHRRNAEPLRVERRQLGRARRGLDPPRRGDRRARARAHAALVRRRPGCARARSSEHRGARAAALRDRDRPAVATASGGPRRDAQARAVRSDGTPIPGLFAVSGSIWGHLTEHGGGLTDAIVFGRMAGAGAAAGPLIETGHH